MLRSFLLSYLGFIIQRILFVTAKNEVEKRKHYSPFRVEELAQPIRCYPFSVLRENNLYGTGYNLQKAFPNLDFKRDAMVEHGLIFGSLVQRHYYNTFAKTVVTFSDYRKQFIKKRLSKEVETIGPYIRHVSPLMSEELIQIIKNKLGRILLVFPSHSISSTNVLFDQESLISKIQEIKTAQKFDTVVVCLYWNDVLLGKHKIYVEAGFKTVTAGHTNDYYFLNRLRSIIQLADMTMSNSAGSHVGYCIAEGKGHYIFNQELKNKNLKAGHNRDLDQRTAENWETFYKDKELIAQAFESYCFKPTSEQIEVVRRFWGEFN